jgi:hypothetical protein
LGGWLKDNVAFGGANRYVNGDEALLYKASKNKPAFWLDDLGINVNQSHRWQNIHDNLTIDELRTGTEQYLRDGASGKEDELTWVKVWILANPRPPKEPEPALEVDLSSGGKIAYRILRKTVKKVITKYFEYINKTSVQTREYMFMSAFFMELAQGLSNAAATLNKTIKEK